MPLCTRAAGTDVGSYTDRVCPRTLTADDYSFVTGDTAQLERHPARGHGDRGPDKTKTYGTDDPALTYQITAGTLVCRATPSPDALTRERRRERRATYAIEPGHAGAAATNYDADLRRRRT